MIRSSVCRLKHGSFIEDFKQHFIYCSRYLKPNDVEEWLCTVKLEGRHTHLCFLMVYQIREDNAFRTLQSCYDASCTIIIMIIFVHTEIEYYVSTPETKGLNSFMLSASLVTETWRILSLQMDIMASGGQLGIYWINSHGYPTKCGLTTWRLGEGLTIRSRTRQNFYEMLHRAAAFPFR
jgi:hypothetical protein